MGQAKLYGQKTSGTNINGIIKDYHAYAGENISAGDLVEFINGVASQTTTIKTTSNTTFYDNVVAPISAVKLNDNSVFVAYGDDGSSKLGAKVLTINDENITVGTEYILEKAVYDISTTLVSANKVAICFANNPDYKTSAIIAVINGTTIAFGTSLAFGTGTSPYFDRMTQIEALNETQLLASWIRYRQAASTSSSYGLKACVLTLNGTTLTASTILNVQTSRQTYQSLCKLSSSRALISYGDTDDSTGSSRVLTISGTSVSTSSKYDFATVSVSFKTSCLISSNKVLIIYMRTNSTGYASVIATISSNDTITFGSTYTIDNSYEVYPKSSCLVETNKILVSFNENGTNNCLQILNVSGTSVISNGDKYILGAGRYHIDTVLMQENRVVTIYNSTDTTNHGNSQVLGISENTISNNIKIIDTVYETQVRKTTTSQFDGIAKTSGVGGDNTGHKDLVSIYTLPVQIPNLISNGDFSNGIEGWSVGDTTYCDIAYENGALKGIAIESNPGYRNIAQYQFTAIQNHIYYCACDVINYSTTGTAYLYISGVTSIEVPTNTNWSKISYRGPVKTWGSEILEGGLIVPRWSAITQGDISYWDNIVLYDLTAKFGAGNEPTKEWCDENL